MPSPDSFEGTGSEWMELRGKRLAAELFDISRQVLGGCGMAVLATGHGIGLTGIQKGIYGHEQHV